MLTHYTVRALRRGVRSRHAPAATSRRRRRRRRQELLESKGLALARGDLTGSSSETSPADAAHLARALHRWYSEAARMAVVRQFNCSPAEFRFADVLAQCGIAPAAR